MGPIEGHKWRLWATGRNGTQNNCTNVPLILKIWEIIFCFGQISLWAISRDILRGPRLF
jgi:hypothetical protein